MTGKTGAAVPPQAARDTLKLLKDLIALDTSDPPGNEILVDKHVQPLLEEDGIEVRIFEPAPGRGNLWARLKGNGRKKPFLIMAHTDVVPAKKEDWLSDPFKAEERKGHLYGRGTIDDKGMAATAITVMKLLARKKVPLDRDIILFLGADEEAAAVHGIEWVIEHHPELMKAEVVLNEGGTIDIEDGEITHARVQNYEKVCMDVTLSADGPSGHSSLPQGDNAVVRIAQAVARVGAYQFPAKLNAVSRAYFTGLGKLRRHPLKKEFAALASGAKGRGYEAAVKKLSRIPQFNAMIRTTCTPTVIEAGFNNNAIPGKAKANVNCRILPNENPRDIVAQLRKVIADPKVILTPGPVDKPAMSPFGDPFFEAIASVLKEMVPEAVTVPYMSIGATDSRKLRYRGMKAYGLVPMPMEFEDKVRMHGNDERVKLSSIGFGVEFLYRLAVAYAGS